MYSMKSEPAVHLPVDMQSPDQVSGVLVELNQYISGLRDAAARVKVGGKADKPELPGHLETLLKSTGVNTEDMPALEALAAHLETIIKDAPVMHITLAAPATRTLKRQLTVWFRTQVHPVSLLTFAARGDIGGGLVIRAGSHIYDYSFRAAILENKTRLMEISGGV
jgi:hypothetical protein